MHIPSLIDGKVERYFGQFLKDSYDQTNPIKYGKGLLINRYDEIYEGWFADDELSGFGRLVQKHGFYIGMFSYSKFHGFGKYFYNNGTVYEGEFRDSRHNGWGTLTWPDGDSYTGDFKNGLKSGVGI